MKTAIFLLCLLGLVYCEELNKYVSSAKEVQDLLSTGSDNCFMILFVWRGEEQTEEVEAKGVQDTFKDYPECYHANLDVARSDTKALLKILSFEDPRDDFSQGREITRDDTPLLLALVNGEGYVASGPKPHNAMKKELDNLYRKHSKTDITYEGAPEEEEAAEEGAEGEEAPAEGEEAPAEEAPARR